MSPFALEYAKQLHHHFHYYVNWLPSSIVSVGDIGILRDDLLFERKGTLLDTFNLSFDTLPQPLAGSDYMTFATGGSTTFKSLARGEADLVNCGIEVSFKTANSFYLSLAGVSTKEIKDQISLEAAILELFWQGKWEKDWVVVTTTLQAESSIILGSQSGGGSIKLEAKVDLPNIDLANTEIGFTTRETVAVDLNIVNEHQLTPLIKVSKIKKRLFGRTIMHAIEEDEVDIDTLVHNVKIHGGEFIDFFQLAEI